MSPFAETTVCIRVAKNYNRGGVGASLRTGYHVWDQEGNVGAYGRWAPARNKVIVGVVAVCLAVCVLSGKADAQERKWKFVKYDDSMFSYYDPEDITYNNENHIVGVWLKFLPVPGSTSYDRIQGDLKRMGVEREYRSLLVRYEIDCENSAGVQREMVCFDKNRSVIESMMMVRGAGEIAIPDDIIEHVAKEVCTKQGD